MMHALISKKLENLVKWFIKFEIAVIIVKIILIFLVLYVLHIKLGQNKMLVAGVFVVSTGLVIVYEKMTSGRFFPKI